MLSIILFSLNIIQYNNPCNYLDFKHRRVFKHPQRFLWTVLWRTQRSYLRCINLSLRFRGFFCLFIFALWYLFRWFGASPKGRRPLKFYLGMSKFTDQNSWHVQVHRSKLVTCPLVRGQLTPWVSHSAPSLLLWSPQNWAAIPSFGIIFIKDVSFVHFGEKHTFPTRIPSHSFLFIHPSPADPAGHSDAVCMRPHPDKIATSHGALV